MNNQRTITALNELILINNDRVKGYQTASDETEEIDLKALFLEMQNTSTKCIYELNNQVYLLGGLPEEGTNIIGKFFRLWMDLKVALSCDDRKTILNSCEFGEEAILEKYENVLDGHNNKDLSEEILSIINTQQMLLKQDHDTIKTLRDRL